MRVFQLTLSVIPGEYRALRARYEGVLAAAYERPRGKKSNAISYLASLSLAMLAHRSVGNDKLGNAFTGGNKQ